ncbi:hypothetical protein [Actinophytocola xanthii]|uniref:Serine peptidase n=1 Tax=Actinophytocola xanthii TaxID=1912961 RepID=A0A1Q8CGL2_9PSEU|nr:hypothetical protein [Actinophytocola xanthii]OLF13498.1 hypothetical protein BU204_27120 [Actinophytocola xanthii]
MRIVGVHGVGNYDPARSPSAAAMRLATTWGAALNGVRQIDLAVAYYAHHLRPVAAQGVEDVGLLDEEVARLVLAWGFAAGAPNELTQGPATVPLRYLTDWVARSFGLDSRLVRWFVAVFFRELATYLSGTDEQARLDAREEVVGVIKRHRPDVVVAHSLGTVVTYEALAANPHLSVDLLVTLGSPLGMPDVVYERLRPMPAGRLPGVRRWVNIADIGDLVAIPRRLGGRFATDADHEETIGLFDFHRVRRYLAAERTRQVLTNAGG